MSNGRVLLFDGWWGWRRAQKFYFSILIFLGIFAGAKGLSGGLGGLGWKGWLFRKFSFQFQISAASPCEARLGGAWGWLRACIGSNPAEKALRASSPHRGFFQGWESRFKKSGPSEGLI